MSRYEVKFWRKKLVFLVLYPSSADCILAYKMYCRMVTQPEMPMNT